MNENICKFTIGSTFDSPAEHKQTNHAISIVADNALWKVSSWGLSGQPMYSTNTPEISQIIISILGNRVISISQIGGFQTVFPIKTPAPLWMRFDRDEIDADIGFDAPQLLIDF